MGKMRKIKSQIINYLFIGILIIRGLFSKNKEAYHVVQYH